jgi:hypothetical protein
MRYITSYTSSNGQPYNGREIHDSLATALTAWQANIGALLQRSGGRSILESWDADSESESAEPAASISWLEHSEGGFIAAGGEWADEVAHLARYEEENSDVLTAAKLIRHFT